MKRLFPELWMIKLMLAAPLVALAACSAGTSQGVAGLASDSTEASSGSPSANNVSGGSPAASPAMSPTPVAGDPGDFIWAIPFSISGLQSGESVEVLLNGQYTRTITQDLAPPLGVYVFVPGTPSSYPGLPIGSSYNISIGQQPNGGTCSVTGDGSAILQTNIAPSTISITCAPTTTAEPSAMANKSLIHSVTTSNGPLLRRGASTVIDDAGTVWLFGGSAPNASSTSATPNDLWRLSPGSGWVQVSGSVTPNEAVRFAVGGDSISTNVPAGRSNAALWADQDGNLWLFGGKGTDAAGATGPLNDLWIYKPSANTWTLVSGSDRVNDPSQCKSTDADGGSVIPSARSNAAAWTDSSSTLWLSAGYGVTSGCNSGLLGDLWSFAPSTGEWTRVSTSTLPALAMH